MTKAPGRLRTDTMFEATRERGGEAGQNGHHVRNDWGGLGVVKTDSMSQGTGGAGPGQNGHHVRNDRGCWACSERTPCPKSPRELGPLKTSCVLQQCRTHFVFQQYSPTKNQSKHLHSITFLVSVFCYQAKENRNTNSFASPQYSYTTKKPFFKHAKTLLSFVLASPG